ncbi:hypothetical protein BB560_000971 [Smittium megazygosporum]|uniref:Small ribosomal subunit protein mS35 mitochondrial conserved domain-containing protein n=1 Tax=Smittium megazygosporum TaxID=133381 RepID=A0A2T9ZIZ2_9FUNG|nr:hypothetical protein BB560_000971 [Smittium megazygosporum]
MSRFLLSSSAAGLIPTFKTAIQPFAAKSRSFSSTIKLFKESAETDETKPDPMYSRKRALQLQNFELDAFDVEKLEPWEGDDHHIYGHALLESIRDVRKYLRKEKYELPVLKKHHKTFVPPTKEQFVVFQTNKVHGRPEEPINRRVTMKLKVSNLNLKPKELHKFLLMVGPRYSPHTDMLVMSADSELTSVLNKKLLSDQLDDLLNESIKGEDKFEDIPLPTYKKPKKVVPDFPKEWLPQPN